MLNEKVITNLQKIYKPKNILSELLLRNNKMKINSNEYIKFFINNNKKFNVLNNTNISFLYKYCVKKEIDIIETFFKDITEDDLKNVFQRFTYPETKPEQLLFVAKFLKIKNNFNFCYNSYDVLNENILSMNEIRTIVEFTLKHSKNVYNIFYYINRFIRKNDEEKRKLFIDMMNNVSEKELIKIINKLTNEYAYDEEFLKKILKNDSKLIHPNNPKVIKKIYLNKNL